MLNYHCFDLELKAQLGGGGGVSCKSCNFTRRSCILPLSGVGGVYIVLYCSMQGRAVEKLLKVILTTTSSFARQSSYNYIYNYYYFPDTVS